MKVVVIAVAALFVVNCKWMKQSKTKEARENVRAIYDGARAYYMAADEAGREPGFPASTPITPRLGACCKGGKDVCPKVLTQWDHPSWRALGFKIRSKHYYSYQFVRNPDGKGFKARAYGDLDCNGSFSTFEMYGTINEAYVDVPAQR